MKDFFKSLIASMLGCAIVLGSLFLIFIIVVAAMVTFDGKEQYKVKNKVKKNSVLSLNLNGFLSDRPDPANPFIELLGGSDKEKASLVDILSAIEIAKTDKDIKGIFINAGAFYASGASLKEMRDALIEFKETDKFIVAYGNMYAQGCYYLSSVADKVIMNPEGSMDIRGYSASPMFYKGFMDKIGVEMQVFKVGTFKSAVEPYIETKMSEHNKEQVSSYLTDMWETLSKGISESRNISIEKLNEIAESATTFKETKYALDNNLVDSLLYETEVYNYLKDLMKVEHSEKIALVSPNNLMSAYPAKIENKKNQIAILYAEGGISSGDTRDGITDKRYVRELKKLAEDENIKAVVFRVNSPGGGAFASEQIWKAVEDLKKTKKPIVVSMGDVAASGGYYISAGADKIFAQPNTITGSIGIFGMIPNIGGLYGKLGLTHDNVKTHQHADLIDVSRPMNESEKAMIQNYVERGYDLFLRRCAEGRKLSTDSINAIGQGRVWTGNQALAIGLIDAIGGLNDAIAEAAKLAELDDYSTSSFPKKMDFMEAFLSSKKDEFVLEMIKDYLGVDYQAVKLMKEIKEQDYLQARMPYDFNIQ